MDLNIPLSSIILGELVFVLLVLLTILLRYQIQQKKIIAKLKEKLTAATTNSSSGFYDKNKPASANPGVTEYFSRALEDSRQRFEKFSASTQIILHKDHPFSGKIAALRHIYLSVEQELFAERGITHAGWGTLERGLAKILQWSEQSSPEHELLQQQLRANAAEIKQHQAKNAHLLKRLENLRKEKHALERTNTTNDAVINQLQDALNKLKNTSTQPVEVNNPPSRSPLSDHYVEQFGAANTTEVHNLRALLNEIKNVPSSLNPAEQKRIENHVHALEIELSKSDRHIHDLKQQLKDARRQITNYALMKKDQAEPLEIDSLYSNLIKKMAPENENDPDTIIAEINNLRESNKHQYNTISNLEDEICTLKGSMSSADPDDVNQAKEKEIQRLERLVKECQGCIVILEEEVDSLYARLQEQTSLLSDTSPHTKIEEGQSAGIEEVELLLQELAKTATNYQHVYAINNALLEILQCRSVDSLVNQLLQFIQAFDLPAGFHIHCAAGKSESVPEHIFDAQQLDQLFAADPQTQLEHIDGATVFVYPNIRAIIRTSGEENRLIMDTNFQMIIAAVDARLNELTLHSSPSHTGDLKDMLYNLNIRYAFQVDENRKTFDHFLTELRRAYGLLELKGPGAVVLDNAVNEFEMRMSLLLESGDAIDKEISLLVEKMQQV